MPDPPTVYKAQVQDARQAPDPSLGERPCARGTECTSYKMSASRKAKDPEKYAHVEPFACKEFFFGPRGQKMRNALAAGIPLTAVKGVQGERLVLCVMCHESEVTRFYKMYDFGIPTFDPTKPRDPRLLGADTPMVPHILQPYKYVIGPGEYPGEACLLGDEEFKGKTMFFSDVFFEMTRLFLQKVSLTCFFDSARTTTNGSPKHPKCLSTQTQSAKLSNLPFKDGQSCLSWISNEEQLGGGEIRNASTPEAVHFPCQHLPGNKKKKKQLSVCFLTLILFRYHHWNPFCSDNSQGGKRCASLPGHLWSSGSR